jgi:hypothetical protein
MEENARKLVQLYIDGWKETNKEKIISVLSTDCIIIESHGPRYNGKEQVREWVEAWKEMKGDILTWDLVSFYYDEKKNAASFQWDFHCVVNKKDHHFLGMSVARFTGGKISYLHEYRMTEDPYDWTAEMKIPE